MKYNLDWLVENFEIKNNLKFLFFWGNQKDRNGAITSSCFSQWFNSPFIVEEITYKTSEHYMMAQKALLFNDQETYSKIILSKSPGQAKDLGREIKNFEQVLWEKRRFEIVVEGNIYKFSQNEELKNFLLNTKERILVEASPVDKIWGIGLSAESENAKNPLLWEGLNLLGFALMETRDILNKK